MTPHAAALALLRALALEAADHHRTAPSAPRLRAFAAAVERAHAPTIEAAARMASTSADAWASAARGSAEWRPLASIWHRAALVLETLAGRTGAPPPIEASARYRWCAGAARGQA